MKKHIETLITFSEKYNKDAYIYDGRFMSLSGNTYEIKEQLKADSFKFDSRNKCWYIDLGEDVTLPSDEIRYLDGNIEELNYLGSFDMLFEGKDGWFFGKTDSGIHRIKL